jgi:hypothetical protein
MKNVYFLTASYGDNSASYYFSNVEKAIAHINAVLQEVGVSQLFFLHELEAVRHSIDTLGVHHSRFTPAEGLNVARYTIERLPVN